MFLLNNAPVSWSSQRQSLVSLSTMKAEYVALAHSAKEALWLRRILNELKIECKNIPMCVDNQSAIKFATNSEFHKRSKHIDVKYHFVRDLIENKSIEVSYVKSEDQLADIFTKGLPKVSFYAMREKLNILESIK